MSLVEKELPAGLEKTSLWKSSEEHFPGVEIQRLCLAEACIRWGDEWEKLIEGDGQGTPGVRPSVISEEMRQRVNCGAIKSRCLGLWEEHALQGLAILPCKTISLGSMMKPLPAGKIHGLRLAGNRIFTTDDERSLPALMDEVGVELRRQHARFLLVEDLETGSKLEREIRRLERQGYLWFWQTAPQPRFKIQFPESAEKYWGTFSSKSRYNLRRQDRRMEETELLCVTEAKGVSRFLELASQISRKTWQQEQLGTRIRNDEHEQRLLSALANQKSLRSYLLMQRGEPVAFLLGMQNAGTFYYEEIGYDRKYAEYSPGTVLLFKVINDLYARSPVEWFDFGFGDAPYKRLFANHERVSGKGWLLPPGLKSRQLKMTLEICHRVREWGRWGLSQGGLLKGLRQKMRRGKPMTESTVPPKNSGEGDVT